MKFVLSIIGTAVISVCLQLVLPWWSIAIAAFSVGFLIQQNSKQAFLSGLLGIATIWWVYSLQIDITTDFILSEKIATLFKVGNSFVLLLLSGLIGGIVGGFSSLSGCLFRQLVNPANS